MFKIAFFQMQFDFVRIDQRSPIDHPLNGKETQRAEPPNDTHPNGSGSGDDNLPKFKGCERRELATAAVR